MAFLDHWNNFISQYVRPISETKYHRFFNIVIKKNSPWRRSRLVISLSGTVTSGTCRNLFYFRSWGTTTLFPVFVSPFLFVSLFLELFPFPFRPFILWRWRGWRRRIGAWTWTWRTWGWFLLWFDGFFGSCTRFEVVSKVFC